MIIFRMTTTLAKNAKLRRNRELLALAKRKVKDGQAVNGQQFCLLVGVSYHIARYWFQLPGFPVVSGFVFWEDFVKWRHAHCGLTKYLASAGKEPLPDPPKMPVRNFEEDVQQFGLRGAQLLADCGPGPDYPQQCEDALRNCFPDSHSAASDPMQLLKVQPTDKQLQSLDFAEVVRRYGLDQSLNMKEFAVLAGVSYSTAQTWFRQPGFPVMSRRVFWRDFVLWRRAQTGLLELVSKHLLATPKPAPEPEPETPWERRAKDKLSRFFAKHRSQSM